jgi:NADPH-dependent 2,4-dienoyl-CoA reductase/sulfur reductase-like enzyme/nitrite reductase/ring-hydroxylating ferredoxin subunit
MADTDPSTPDFREGFPWAQLPDGGMVAGRAGGDRVMLARQGDEVFAVGAHCTHYHGPLADGLLVGDTVRCPWHHACFNLRTGEAVRAPALDPIACWRVERVGDTIFVREKLGELPAAAQRPTSVADVVPTSVVIIGGGAAALAAADMLRREGYGGPVTMISADAAPPCDRPNLSKDYLAGTAQEDWIPLRSPEFYTEHRIELVLGSLVSSIDVGARRVRLEDGRTHAFGSLLVATGAEPVRLEVAGDGASRIHYLRTFADSRAIVAAASSARRALVIGASFIGLEVAASLRARGLAVHVVAPEAQPLERVMGPDVGRLVRTIHEEHEVAFHLGATVEHVGTRTVTLSDGTVVEADLVVAGVGVRPAIGLAEQAGLAIDRGVAVNEYLETSAPGVFASGDIARWPDPYTGDRIRVEHWVVAERQGQTAARNILGRRERFEAVPFFWSQHYDVAINYVGHAEAWDDVAIDGDLAARDCAVTYRRAGRTLAVATIARDRRSLEAEAEMENASDGLTSPPSRGSTPTASRSPASPRGAAGR